MEEMEEIKKMVRGLITDARKARIMESQSNSHLGFVYFQGVIDMGIDILENLDKLQQEEIQLEEDNAYC